MDTRSVIGRDFGWTEGVTINGEHEGGFGGGDGAILYPYCGGGLQIYRFTNL